MLVYFEPAALCDLHSEALLLAPLPARRGLWEAGDACSWKVEVDKGDGAQMDFGMAVGGELVRVDGQLGVDCGDGVRGYPVPVGMVTPRGTADWEEWCGGMDGLGGLVLLAAALVG